jgi:hypothetical protein
VVGQSWGLKIGFGFPTFLAKRATFPAAGKVAGWPEDFVLKNVLKIPNGYEYILYWSFD